MRRPSRSSSFRLAPGEGRKTLSTVVGLWPFIWPGDRPDLKRRVLYAFAALLATKVITILVPYSFKWATDALTGATGGAHHLHFAPGSWAAVAVASPVIMVGLYGAGRILMVLFGQARDALFAKVALHAVRRLAKITFEHLHILSLRFHMERRTGGLSRVVERGTKGIETIVRMSMLTVIPTAVELVFVFAVLGYQFDWRYMLVIAVMVTAYLWFTYVASEWRISIRRVMNDSDTDANAKAVDSLLNYETVKYFGNEGWEVARFDRSMARYEKAAVKTYMSLAWLNAGQVVIFTIGLAVVMGLSARDVMAGHNTVGDFVLVNAMMIQLYQPLNVMGMVYRELKQALIDIESMFFLLGRKAEIVDAPDAKPLRVAAGTVRFDHVSFHYDPDREILKDVSFEVPAGRTVAIVGASGAGKSTISRLLFRFYDVTGGAITIDGQDIRKVTQASLRDAIGMVPQDTVLFNDTVLYNIRYGRVDATDAEVREAARLAQIDDFIRTLPQGYDAEVGERGLKLSGGEKQRVAIARTILKGPPILLLDEATSALDSYTEKEIQNALERVSRGRTTLIIAHRLSTIIGADEIIVLDHGRIVERGTHAELLLRGGVFAGMWRRQQEADEARRKLAADAEVESEAEAEVALAPDPDALAEAAADGAADEVETLAERRVGTF
ncbi:MAG TPA: ABC transporter ATP-binding protein/permease [Hyphomicrobiales bacterium]|nr:ABC transporter ATP-binding protein/permease [Hyphomicrobiales bacterium]